MNLADAERVTASQLRAARALLNWSGAELSRRTRLGLRTLRRAEQRDGPLGMTAANASLVVSVLEAAGVEFVFGEDGRAGVLLHSSPSSTAER